MISNENNFQDLVPTSDYGFASSASPDCLETALPLPGGQTFDPNQELLSPGANAPYASSIEVLLRQWEQRWSQEAVVSPTDGQNGLPSLLRKISGCGWMRGQLGTRTRIPGNRPSHAPKAVKSQNGHCAACQSDWPQADRFCADLASKARDHKLQWREVAELIDALARRIMEARMPESPPIVRDETGIISRQDFAEFTGRYYAQLIRYYRFKHLDLEDAQDLAQEAFLVFWKRRDKSVPPHRSFLFGIARRLYFAFLRTRQTGTMSLDEFPGGEDGLASGLVDNVEAELLPDHGKQVADLLALAGALSQCQRKVIQLRYAKGLSLRQTADKLGLSASTVQIHEHRALAALRRLAIVKFGNQ